MVTIHWHSLGIHGDIMGPIRRSDPSGSSRIDRSVVSDQGKLRSDTVADVFFRCLSSTARSMGIPRHPTHGIPHIMAQSLFATRSPPWVDRPSWPGTRSNGLRRVHHRELVAADEAGSHQGDGPWTPALDERKRGGLLHDLLRPMLALHEEMKSRRVTMHAAHLQGGLAGWGWQRGANLNGFNEDLDPNEVRPPFREVGRRKTRP